MSDGIDTKVDNASAPPAYPAEGYAVYPNAPADKQQPQPSYPGVMPPGYSQVPEGHPGYPLPQAPEPVIATQPILGPGPAQFFCLTCNQTVVSNVYYESGVLTWSLVSAIFFLGGLLCCLLPLCCDSVKDVKHVCPKCRRSLGIYNQLR